MTNPTPLAARNLRELSIRPYSVDDHRCVLTLAGEVDLASSPDLRAALTQLLDHGYTQFVLDLSGVSHMDSTGLGVLVGLQNRLEERGGLSLAGVSSNLARLLAVVGLNSRLPSFSSVEAALAKTGGSPERSAVPVELSHGAARPRRAEPDQAAGPGPAVPIGADAGLVLGLASTALPFAESELAEAERWLRILRRYGEAGRILRNAGVQEAPFADFAATESHHLDRLLGTGVEERLASVGAQAQRAAVGRRSDAIGTVDVLKAVVATYGPNFDRVLEAYGGDRGTLDAHLSTA